MLSPDTDESMPPRMQESLDMDAWARTLKREALRVRAVMPWAELDDLIQEGAVALLDACERFDAGFGSRFEAFAYQRVRGAMIDSLRRKGADYRRATRYPDEVAENTIGSSLDEGDPLTVLVRGASLVEMADAVAGLPKRSQEVLQMFYTDGFNQVEIAAVLGCSESYVSRLRRDALQRLRNLLVDRPVTSG